MDRYFKVVKGNFFKFKDGLAENIDSHLKPQNDVVLFFSFDIVNSTSYKRINYFGWSKVLLEIFKYLNRVVKSEIENSELWRTIGDETVFLVRITEKEQVYQNIDKVFKVLIAAVESIKNGAIFNGSSLSIDEINEIKMQNIISLKATSWIAVVSKNFKQDGKIISENLYEEYFISDNYRTIDFLGNDIDAGFRVAQYSRERRLAISFELAHMLSEKTEFLPRLYLISFKSLKGIWDDRLYPIIWYHNAELYKQVSFDDSFYYDELSRDELSKEYFLCQEDENSVVNTQLLKLNTNQAIVKISSDLNLTDKIKKIYEAIDNTTAEEKDAYINISLLEMHCVAVCINIITDKIFIVKRLNRKIYDNTWEFGCAKADLRSDIKDTLIEDYKSEFGFDIKIYEDDTRNDKQPVPIAVYNVPKGKNRHKGFIFLAFTENDEPKFNKERYSDYKWISTEEVTGFVEEGIPDFKRTIEQAFDLYKELKINNKHGN